jgi:hypothetical protein
MARAVPAGADCRPSSHELADERRLIGGRAGVGGPVESGGGARGPRVGTASAEG